MGLLGDDRVIVKGDPYQHGAGYPLAPPPAAHQARLQRPIPAPPHLPTPSSPDFSLPRPHPWAHFRRKRETRSICTTWSRKGDTAEEPVVSATRQIHNMGLSGQIKSLQGGLLWLCPAWPWISSPKPGASLSPAELRGPFACCGPGPPLPVAVGVPPGASHSTALPSPPVRKQQDVRARKMGPVWRAETQSTPTTGKSQR